MTRDELAARGEALHEELGREAYLTGAGLKAAPAFQAIYQRYEDLAGDAALATARASGSPALLEWIVDVRIGRRVAPFDEQQLVWEQQAVVAADGEAVPYLRVPIVLANTADRERRRRLDEARAAVVRDLEPIRRERFLVERDAVRAAGFADYVDAVAFLSGVDVRGLAAQAQAFLDATAGAYRECLAQLVRRRLGVPVAQLTRGDVPWVFRAERFDGAFPERELVPLAARQMHELGLEVTRGGRIRFDTAEREGKQPRAFCAPVRVPDEVYLVIRPRGGHHDYRTLWHELGHALHFASVDRDLPFEARWLGDNSVTEGFAMLWDHMTLDAVWLRRYTTLSAGEVRDLVFENGVNEMYLVRRYAAKLLYEIELHRSDLTGMGERYAELLSAATLFRYPAADYLVDVDPGLYAARYLRAWQLQALCAAALTERYDDDWFRNPAAGSVIEEWMRRGQRDPAHVLAQDVSGRPLGFEAVVQGFERMVA